MSAAVAKSKKKKKRRKRRGRDILAAVHRLVACIVVFASRFDGKIVMKRK